MKFTKIIWGLIDSDSLFSSSKPNMISLKWQNNQFSCVVCSRLVLQQNILLAHIGHLYACPFLWQYYYLLRVWNWLLVLDTPQISKPTPKLFEYLSIHLVVKWWWGSVFFEGTYIVCLVIDNVNCNWLLNYFIQRHSLRYLF